MSTIDTDFNRSAPMGDVSLRITLQGEFNVLGPDNIDLTPRGQKACALLAMLVTHPAASRSRAWLRAQLWSDRGAPESSSSLRQCLSEIRRALGPCADLLESDRRMVRLLPRSFVIERSSEIFLDDISIPDPAYNAWVEDMRRHGSYASPFSPALSSPAPSRRAADAIHRFPSVTVEAAPGRQILSECLNHVRRSLTNFRWLSVVNGSQDDIKADYTVRVEEASPHGMLNTVSLSGAHGRLLWSEQRDKPEHYETNIPFEDEVIGNIAVVIANTEEQQAADEPDRTDIRNLIWRGRWHLNHMTREDAEMADRLFAEAKSLAPHDADVGINIAYAAVARAWVYRLNEQALEEVIQIAKQAASRAPTDARGFYNLGTALCFAGKTELARIATDEAIRLCPNMAMAWIQQGCNLLAAGQYAAAIPVYHRCLTLGRYERRSYVPRCGLALAHLYLGEVDDAIHAAECAIALRPGYWYAHMVRGVACRRAGYHDEAARSLKTMRSIYPRVTRTDVEWLPNGDQKALERLVLDAGLSE